MKDKEALFFFANKKPVKLAITRYFESVLMGQKIKSTFSIEKNVLEIREVEYLELGNKQGD